jgi:hypothetical protein
MRDLLFWTWVVGGTPFVSLLIQRAAEWLRDAVLAGIIAPGVGQLKASVE